MSSQSTPIFKVNGVHEEYAIINRMLCPVCEDHLKVEYQLAITRKDGSIRGDRMKLRCINTTCNREAEVIFLLPDDYKPFEMS